MTPACPKPTKQAKKRKKRAPMTERRAMEMEVERLARELVWWRDGGLCVLREIDGARCGGVIQWCHFVPRKKSPYMIYLLGNSFCGCANHNGLDHWGDDVFGVWYGSTFGTLAHEAVWREIQLHINQKPELWELEEWIARYRYLLDDRPAVYTCPLLIELGYFGTWPQKYAVEG